MPVRSAPDRDHPRRVAGLGGRVEQGLQQRAGAGHQHHHAGRNGYLHPVGQAGAPERVGVGGTVQRKRCRPTATQPVGRTAGHRDSSAARSGPERGPLGGLLLGRPADPGPHLGLLPGRLLGALGHQFGHGAWRRGSRLGRRHGGWRAWAVIRFQVAIEILVEIAGSPAPPAEAPSGPPGAGPRSVRPPRSGRPAEAAPGSVSRCPRSDPDRARGSLVGRLGGLAAPGSAPARAIPTGGAGTGRDRGYRRRPAAPAPGPGSPSRRSIRRPAAGSAARVVRTVRGRRPSVTDAGADAAVSPAGAGSSAAGSGRPDRSPEVQLSGRCPASAAGRAGAFEVGGVSGNGRVGCIVDLDGPGGADGIGSPRPPRARRPRPLPTRMRRRSGSSRSGSGSPSAARSPAPRTGRRLDLGRPISAESGRHRPDHPAPHPRAVPAHPRPRSRRSCRRRRLPPGAARRPGRRSDPASARTAGPAGLGAARPPARRAHRPAAAPPAPAAQPAAGRGRTGRPRAGRRRAPPAARPRPRRPADPQRRAAPAAPAVPGRTRSPVSTPTATGSTSTAAAHAGAGAVGNAASSGKRRALRGVGGERGRGGGAHRDPRAEHPAHAGEHRVGQVAEREQGERRRRRRSPGAVSRYAAAMSGRPSTRSSTSTPRPAVSSPVSATAAARPAAGSHSGQPVAPLRGQPAGPQHPDRAGRPGDQPAAEHRRPRRHRHLCRARQQRAAQHGHRGVRTGDAGQHRLRRRPGTGRRAGGPPSALRTRPPATTPAVGSSGSTLSGCPSMTSGIWCAASQSGIAAANAASSGIPAGSTDDRRGRHQQRVADQDRAHRAGQQQPQPVQALDPGRLRALDRRRPAAGRRGRGRGRRGYGSPAQGRSGGRSSPTGTPGGASRPPDVLPERPAPGAPVLSAAVVRSAPAPACRNASPGQGEPIPAAPRR